MVMRKLTVTYELPESLWVVLEEQAKSEGRPMEDVIAEYRRETRPVRPKLSPEEAERRHKAFVALFGTCDTGDPHSSDNDRIDADLAREYQGER